MITKDLICGMTVETTKTVDVAHYAGKEYHFCSTPCKTNFEKDPEKYTSDQ